MLLLYHMFISLSSQPPNSRLKSRACGGLASTIRAKISSDFSFKRLNVVRIFKRRVEFCFGCQSETRTHNLRINSALLYRLSYPTICRITLAILQNIIKGVVFNYKLFTNCKTKIKLWNIIFFSKILADKISLNENNILITNNYWLIVTSCSFTEQLVFKS